MNDKVTPFDRERRLSEIIRKVKVATAERDDVVVDMKEADKARLEILAEELREVIEAVPDEVDLFDFALSSGSQPRLWIDAVSHVQLGRDRRTYRFVRDTRIGRDVVAETGDVREAADAVSNYIAERLIERQRIIEGDAESMKDFYARLDAAKRVEAENDAKAVTEAGVTGEALPAMVEPRSESPSSGGFVIGLLWFILGCVAGAGILATFFWERIEGFIR